MTNDLKISLFDMVSCISNVVDMVNPLIVDHHKQVAYIALCIAKELKLPLDQQQDLVLAGALHDIGAVFIDKRLHDFQFDLNNSDKHAELGYQLLKMHAPFAKITALIRCHHVPWQNGSGSNFEGSKVPPGSHILHLADRVAVSIDKQQEILSQSSGIYRKIEDNAGETFIPELVTVMKNIATKEYFWCDLESNKLGNIISKAVVLPTIEYDIDDLLSLTMVFSHIIDFRSRFTAAHSSGVASTATLLAKLARFTARECKMMTVAGYLHDLGKLAVPAEILEKQSGLTRSEFNLIKHHPYLTYHALETISGLETINSWASLHHERMNGSGYPFHYSGDDLSLGSRIMAVADVFTAITEDRPYRKGMSEENALHTLRQMAENSILDSELVDLLEANFDDISQARKTSQTASISQYGQLMQFKEGGH